MVPRLMLAAFAGLVTGFGAGVFIGWGVWGPGGNAWYFGLPMPKRKPRYELLGL